MRNLLLLLVSVTLGVLAIEGLLRVGMDRSDLYRGLELYPSLYTHNKEYRFYEKHHNHVDGFSTYDADLGWDFDRDGDRIRGNRKIEAKPPESVLRLLSIGDSFTYGTEVGAQENFSARLESSLGNSEVLNMAVPGYGIDQAIWKYQHHGRQYAPNVVILGIYTDDYARTGLSFGAYAKPMLQQTAGGFELANYPVPTPQQELDRIGQAIDQEWYTPVLLRNSWKRLRGGTGQTNEYFGRNDARVANLLEQLKNGVAEAGGILMIVHIPPAELFVEEVPIQAEISRRLIAIYKQLEIQHVDVIQEFAARLAPRQIHDQLYVLRDDGTAGHLSAAGHQLVAELLAHHIAE